MARIFPHLFRNPLPLRDLRHRLDGGRQEEQVRRSSGFTLVEIIVSLLLVGLIGTFTLFFLADGIEGYFISQRAADAAFKAQLALDRIRLELLSIENLAAAPVENTSIQYNCSDPELTGSRALLFSGGTLYLRVDGTDYPLIDDVASPVLHVELDDMDNDSLPNEVAYIDVGFTIGNQDPYSVRIYPRGMVAKFP